jgi:membrane protein DedA with SNARE-associated domain
VTWVPILLLGLAGFFAGGAWSFRSQGNRTATWVMAALAVLALVGAVAWAWDAR